MPSDEQGEFEWAECEECNGTGRVESHLDDPRCFHCEGGRIKWRPSDEDWECANCHDAGCEHCDGLPPDESPLCDPSAVIKEDDGTDVIPW